MSLFRFHLLQEFDEGKRSCRRRLAGHNRRRRKTHPDTAIGGTASIEDKVNNYLLLSLIGICANLNCKFANFAIPHIHFSFFSLQCYEIVFVMFWRNFLGVEYRLRSSLATILIFTGVYEFLLLYLTWWKFSSLRAIRMLHGIQCAWSFMYWFI